MNIFNSLGSNYDFRFVLKALFANNEESHKEKLINFLGKKYEGRAIPLYKGREAINLVLEILKLPKESFVAINGFTCFAVYKAVMEAGYEAEILDLDNKYDLNFLGSMLQKSIKRNPKIKVVIVQNTLGYPCDIEGIAKICRENNLILIEDLAHCVGAIYQNGKEVGTIGDFVVLSFSQDKIIDAISGGALVIRNRKYLNRHSGEPRLVGTSPESLRGLHDRGDLDLARMTKVNTHQQLLDRSYPLFTFLIRKTYPIGIGKLLHFILKSLNLLSKPMNETFYAKYDLPNWYCSLILNAFDNLKKNLNHRNKIVGIYNSMLDKKIVSYPSTLRYAIFINNRKSLIEFLKNKGVYISDIWYDDVDKSLLNANLAANTILNLPTHKNVSENEARRIVHEINLWLKSQ